jgi:hypothetical protein
MEYRNTGKEKLHKAKKDANAGILFFLMETRQWESCIIATTERGIPRTRYNPVRIPVPENHDLRTIFDKNRKNSHLAAGY